MHNLLTKVAFWCAATSLLIAPIYANAQTLNPSMEVTYPALSSSDEMSLSLASIEQAVHQQINEYRVQQGLPPLTIDQKISDIARTHSHNMANGRVSFGHDGFEQRTGAISKTISYSSAAENVAYNQGYGDPATKAVQGWLNSSGHLKNIEGNYNLTGIGVAKNEAGEYYFTQIFIQKARTNL